MTGGERGTTGKERRLFAAGGEEAKQAVAYRADDSGLAAAPAPTQARHQVRILASSAPKAARNEGRAGLASAGQNEGRADLTGT